MNSEKLTKDNSNRSIVRQPNTIIPFHYKLISLIHIKTPKSAKKNYFYFSFLARTIAVESIMKIAYNKKFFFLFFFLYEKKLPD